MCSPFRSLFTIERQKVGSSSHKRLPQRVGDAAALAACCAKLERERNDRGAGKDWRFTTADARIKLKRLYPTIEER